MRSRKDSYEGMTPAKLGTVPMLLFVHGNDKPRLAVGNWVRVRDHRHRPWQKVLVTRVDPDGYFMADQ